VLAPGLVVDRIYCGYWFWGRPSIYDLWADLRDLCRRIRPDFDPLVPAVRDEWFVMQRWAPAARSATPTTTMPYLYVEPFAPLAASGSWNEPSAPVGRWATWPPSMTP
jgi:hypothetical protein